MKLYVASAFSEWPQARAFMRSAQGLGHTITYDWTEVAERVLVQHTKEDIAIQGHLDTDGVNEAEALILLCGDAPMYGSLMEFGGAAFAGKPCIVVGAERFRIDTTPFYHLPNVKCVPDVVAALKALEDPPPRRTTWLNVQRHYDHDEVAPYIPRAQVQTRWSLGGYDGPLVGLVQYEGRWLTAHCEDRDARDRAFWLVNIGQERTAALLDYAERRFAVFGNSRYHPDGRPDDCLPPGGHGTVAFMAVARLWQEANPMPSYEPKPGDPVIGYFCNWRQR